MAGQAVSGTAETVDYRRTALRRPWQSLPGAVTSAIEVELGGPAKDVQLAGGGFTPGFAAMLTGPDRSLFVKAAPRSDTFIYEAYLRESQVLCLLPAGLPIPRLISSLSVVDDAAADSGEAPNDWQVLCFEPIHGYMPGDPWLSEDLEKIHSTLLQLQTELSFLPTHLTGGPMSLGLSDNPEVNSVFARLSGAPGLPVFLPAWVGPKLAELQALCDASASALSGDAILHNDVRPDNIIMRSADGRAFLCDWNFLAHGPRWADWVGLLVYARHGGLDAQHWVRSSPLSADAKADDIDSWLAILAAYMTHFGMQPDLPSSPLLRAHGRFTARITLEWLAERRWR